jgi:hypothetical protein
MAAGEKRNPTHYSGPLDIGAGKYRYLTAAYTVTHADSGTTFVLKGSAGKAITMPAYKEGFNCRFVVTEAFSTDWVITLATAIGSGVIDEAGAIQVCAAKSVFTLEDDKESLGDQIWFEDVDDITVVWGQFQTAASITVA